MDENKSEMAVGNGAEIGCRDEWMRERESLTLRESQSN